MADGTGFASALKRIAPPGGGVAASRAPWGSWIGSLWFVRNQSQGTE